VQYSGCMRDILHKEVEVPCEAEEAWGHVIDPSWLGDDGELTATPGSEGWVKSGDDIRYLVVEEVEEERRLAYRWASFTEEPTRVEIELSPTAEGTRITISESPLQARAQACLALR
jgi:uncharacterized protein YndB with AHSA1/START domain